MRKVEVFPVSRQHIFDGLVLIKAGKTPMEAAYYSNGTFSFSVQGVSQEAVAEIQPSIRWRVDVLCRKERHKINRLIRNGSDSRNSKGGNSKRRKNKDRVPIRRKTLKTRLEMSYGYVEEGEASSQVLLVAKQYSNLLSNITADRIIPHGELFSMKIEFMVASLETDASIIILQLHGIPDKLLANQGGYVDNILCRKYPKCLKRSTKSVRRALKRAHKKNDRYCYNLENSTSPPLAIVIKRDVSGMVHIFLRVNNIETPHWDAKEKLCATDLSLDHNMIHNRCSTEQGESSVGQRFIGAVRIGEKFRLRLQGRSSVYGANKEDRNVGTIQQHGYIAYSLNRAGELESDDMHRNLVNYGSNDRPEFGGLDANYLKFGVYGYIPRGDAVDGIGKDLVQITVRPVKAANENIFHYPANMGG